MRVRVKASCRWNWHSFGIHAHLAGRGVDVAALGGGIGTRGPGETQLETDRRKIYRRIRHVEQQLENAAALRSQQRRRREAVPVATVALVGYTNAENPRCSMR